MGKKKRKNPAAVALGRRGGKVGGRSKSPAKRRAVRKNAKLGGRPRKEEVVPPPAPPEPSPGADPASDSPTTAA